MQKRLRVGILCSNLLQFSDDDLPFWEEFPLTLSNIYCRVYSQYQIYWGPIYTLYILYTSVTIWPMSPFLQGCTVVQWISNICATKTFIKPNHSLFIHVCLTILKKLSDRCVTLMKKNVYTFYSNIKYSHFGFSLCYRNCTTQETPQYIDSGANFEWFPSQNMQN